MDNFPGQFFSSGHRDLSMSFNFHPKHHNNGQGKENALSIRMLTVHSNIFAQNRSTEDSTKQTTSSHNTELSEEEKTGCTEQEIRAKLVPPQSSASLEKQQHCKFPFSGHRLCSLRVTRAKLFSQSTGKTKITRICFLDNKFIPHGFALLPLQHSRDICWRYDSCSCRISGYK